MINTTDSTNFSKPEIDETKLSRMRFKIYSLEHTEITTHEKTKSEMVECIKKIIEQEAKKCN